MSWFDRIPKIVSDAFDAGYQLGKIHGIEEDSEISEYESELKSVWEEYLARTLEEFKEEEE